MTILPRVLHLVDDTTAGGVMRVVDYIATSSELQEMAKHSVKSVTRGRFLRQFDADVIVSHLAISWRTLPALITLRARNPGKVLVHVEHSYTEAFTALNVTHSTRFYTLLRCAFALFDRVVAVSHAQGNWLTERGLIGKYALTVIPSAVDTESFTKLAPPNTPVKKIGAIGRLDTQKGFDMLISAFRGLPDLDVTLEIYGDGPERGALEALAPKDRRIHFHGHTARPEIAMGAVDAVVMPSRWEAFGLVALEARAAGRPVLVSTVDGLRDQAKDGCISVDTFTIPAWQRAIRALCEGTFPAPDAATAERAGKDFIDHWTKLLCEFLPEIDPKSTAYKSARKIEGQAFKQSRA